VPAALLLAYALVFGWTALGGGLLAFDDHPGQLYRLAHALTLGLAPWRLNQGWWAGYAELQFYPPGWFYLGAALHAASLGLARVETVYQALLWVTWLLPGVTTFLLLHRLLPSAWLALPGAFLALTLSAGSRSGVEEGLRWGLVAGRLALGLLPLLALSLEPWLRQRGRAPLAAAVLLAAITVTHPAHAPAAVALVVLAAWHGPGPRGPRLLASALLLLLAGGLAGFWIVPLLAHLDMALPLAWGRDHLTEWVLSAWRRPLLALLAAGLLAVLLLARRAPAAASPVLWLARWPLAVLGLILADALVVEPLGLRWLPADRLLDSLLLALIVGASPALAAVHSRSRRVPDWALGAAAVTLSALLSWGPGEPTLTLWPRAREWPTYDQVARGQRLEELWLALTNAPPGRILFVRSAVPLEYRPVWWRPHSHVTALAPLRAGRDILNGTFTHPSPVAGLVYTGSPVNRPVTLLVERRDGETLFGRPLEALEPEEFDRLAGRLRISVVVALDEDEGRLGFARRNPAWAGPERIGPFRLFASREPRPTPEPLGHQRWRLESAGTGWRPAGFAWSPLWRATAGTAGLETRRDDLGLLEVRAPGTVVMELEHRPGLAEWAGLASSFAALVLAGLARGWRRP
jgi:hypothetical protein